MSEQTSEKAQPTPTGPNPAATRLLQPPGPREHPGQRLRQRCTASGRDHRRDLFPPTEEPAARTHRLPPTVPQPTAPRRGANDDEPRSPKSALTPLGGAVEGHRLAPPNHRRVRAGSRELWSLHFTSPTRKTTARRRRRRRPAARSRGSWRHTRRSVICVRRGAAVRRLSARPESARTGGGRIRGGAAPRTTAPRPRPRRRRARCGRRPARPRT